MRECGDILGVTPKLAMDKRMGKHILEHIFAQLVEFKKSCQVHLPWNLRQRDRDNLPTKDTVLDPFPIAVVHF